MNLMNVLFVEQDPAMLRSIRRTLRHLPAATQVELEADPRQALARLAQHRYDLVVSAARLPASHGAQILRAAASQHPAAVRALLSSPGDEAEVGAALPHAHLLVATPFEPETLRDLLQRAAALGAMPLSEPLRQRLGALRALPPLPRLFVSLHQMLAADDRRSSLTDIAGLVHQDLALTTKILQLANSALFAAHAPPDHLLQAIQVLGTDLIAGLVLQHALFQQTPLPAALLPWRERLNREGLATSALAGRIARQQGSAAELRDAAMLAGLLHDAGRLVLAQETTDPAIQDRLGAAWGTALCQQEEAAFGAHHGLVGAYLLRLWGFPDAVADAVAWHHQPAAAREQEFSALTLVHVAAALINPAPGQPLEIDREYLGALGCLPALPAWAALAPGVLPDSH
jgi:putative nucleotidyltransferase with HDIG domain